VLHLSLDEDGSKHFLVDFEQKTLTAQAERRRVEQQNAASSRTERREQDEEDRQNDEELPTNPDDQWSVSAAVSACFCSSLQQNF